MQHLQQRQQQRRAIQLVPHVPGRSVTASDDTWRIEMKCAFPGPTATHCCSTTTTTTTTAITTAITVVVLIITSAEGGYVFTSVCLSVLSVCLSVRRIIEKVVNGF